MSHHGTDATGTGPDMRACPPLTQATANLVVEAQTTRIRELEAELAALKAENAGLRSHQACTERAEQAEAEVADMTRQRDAAVMHGDTFNRAWEELQAELAALKEQYETLVEWLVTQHDYDEALVRKWEARP